MVPSGGDILHMMPLVLADSFRRSDDGTGLANVVVGKIYRNVAAPYLPMRGFLLPEIILDG